MKILVVEDNPITMDALEAFLRLSGHSSTYACTGRGTFMRLAISIPDVVLLDLHLTDMNGKEVIEKMRSDPKHKDVKIVVLTAGSDKEISELPGDIPVLRKPFEPEELLVLLKKVDLEKSLELVTSVS